MKFRQFIDFLSGYSYLMRKNKDTTRRETEVLIDIIKELKGLLTKEERKRYNYTLAGIQRNLREIKEKSNKKIKELEKKLLKLKAST